MLYIYFMSQTMANVKRKKRQCQLICKMRISTMHKTVIMKKSHDDYQIFYTFRVILYLNLYQKSSINTVFIELSPIICYLLYSVEVDAVLPRLTLIIAKTQSTLDD